MATNNFDTQLDQALDFSTSATDPYSQSYEALKQITVSIERKLNQDLAGDPIQIEIEPGFKATIGQQLRVILRIPDKQYRDTLFRAYVPENGFPIQLDLYGEQAEPCNTEEELQSKILDFLKRVKERMASYRNYAKP